MHFRPYPLLTVLTLIGLGILVWLGSWQWSRMDDKAAAIAAFETVANRAPVPLETAMCGEVEAGQAVTLPSVGEDSVLRFWGRGPDGASGWRLFAPADRPAARARPTSWIALIESPPSSKKESSTPTSGTPSTSATRRP